MVSTNEFLMDDFTRQSIDIIRLEAGMQKKVIGMMKKLEIDLITQLQNIDPTAVSAASYRLGRLQALLKQTQDTIKTGYRNLRATTSRDLTELALSENVTTLQTINNVLGVDLLTVSFNRSVALSLARNTQIQGVIPSKWWARQAASLQRNFSDQLSIGLLAGETNNQLVQRIRGTSTGKRNVYWINNKKKIYTEFSGGIMDTGTRQAEALVRTSVQSVAQDARMVTFKENSDIIKGVAASVTFDLKTTDICKSRSGFAWYLDSGKPLNSITTISFPGSTPWHWNCRTQMVPVTKSWKELSQKNQSRLGRSPKNLKESMDGQVSADQPYEQWLKKQSVKRQKIAIGSKGKYDLWKKRKINFRELVDQSGNSLTIEELKKVRKK